MRNLGPVNQLPPPIDDCKPIKRLTQDQIFRQFPHTIAHILISDS